MGISYYLYCITPLKELGVSFCAIAIESQGNVNSGAAMRIPPFPKLLYSEALCPAACFPDDQGFCEACAAAGTAPTVCKGIMAAARGGEFPASGLEVYVSASGREHPAPGCLRYLLVRLQKEMTSLRFGCKG